MNDDKIVLYAIGGILAFNIIKPIVAPLIPTSSASGTQKTTGITGDFYGILDAQNAQQARPYVEDAQARLHFFNLINPFTAFFASQGLL